MYYVDGDNVNDVYPILLDRIKRYGEEVQTRNGTALTLTEPVFIEVYKPTERVLFDKRRNCNPFFHVMEGLWMLAGRRDVELVAGFNKRMEEYSDDGKTFNAAYGYRWRNHFGYDQISRVCDLLKRNPLDRRAVIAMWDATQDGMGDSKDYPCNLSISCRIVNGRLDFTITNRSNDLIFGLCGANAVHMSMLQEYMATRIGVKVGVWYHLTNNLHVYEMHYPLLHDVEDKVVSYPPSMPLVEDWEAFDDEVVAFCNGEFRPYHEPFIARVAIPMQSAWYAWKARDVTEALYYCGFIESEDLNTACTNWINTVQERRDAITKEG